MYGFALGILYAYCREKSGSLLAPITGCNVSDGLECVFDASHDIGLALTRMEAFLTLAG